MQEEREGVSDMYPSMTRIGEPQKTRIVRRVPVPARRVSAPEEPERVPVPVRKVPEPEEPEKVPVPVRRVSRREEPNVKIWENSGFRLSEILYYCPICGRELEQEDGRVYCPKHGIFYE